MPLTDMLDLSRVNIYNSPDVRNWPIGVHITGVHLRPGKESGGFSFDFSPRHSWPNYTPPGWTPGGEGLQYTVWLGLLVGSAWRFAGLIQMWRTRPSTGAPLPENIKDWVYDPNRWGPMVSAPVGVGTKIALMLTAGNARKGSAVGPEPDVTSVGERSQVVLIDLPANQTGDWFFTAETEETGQEPEPVPVPQPTPQPVPTPTPVPAPTPALALDAVVDALDRNTAAITAQTEMFKARLDRLIKAWS